MVSSAQTSSGTYKKTEFLPVRVDNRYQIGATAIIPGSEILTIRDKILLKSDYSFNYLSNSFSLSESLAYSIFDTIRIEYEAIFTSLTREYKKRELKSFIALSGEDTVKGFNGFENMLSPDNIFGAGMQKSGTLVRGFSFGTNKDLSLQSGLKLQ
jgi:hypothetical protein